MVLNIYKMKSDERIYVYSQSQQLQGQTGCIGHLRGDFDSSGNGFYTTWDDHRIQYLTEEFKAELDEVVNALRAKDGCGLLKDRASMAAFCQGRPEAAFEGNYCPEYGFRLKTMKHTYMLRCNPNKGDYNFYLYCYVSRFLEQHMDRARQGIRFIDPNYKELFCIPDGDQVQITLSDGEKLLRICRFIDEAHVEVGNNLYHICEFAERMERAGNQVIPFRASLPGQCFSVLPSTGEAIIIKKGEPGYTPSSIQVEGKSIRESVDIKNQVIGVTRAQEAAMLTGSMFGWAVPGADPHSYDNDGNPNKPKKNWNLER